MRSLKQTRSCYPATVRLRSAAIAAFCILLIYLLIPTKTYYWDGVLFSFYAEQARQGQMTFGSLFHPNHLIYTPLAYAVSISGVRTIRILQAVNAMAGASCAFVLFQLMRRGTGSDACGFASMLLFAFGATWWKFSGDADAYILSVLFCLAAVWFALGGGEKSWLGAVACHVLAMLFHELAIFLYVPMLFAQAGAFRRLKYVAVSGALIAVAYWGAYIVSGHPGHATLLSWITSYAGDTPVTHSVQQVVGGYLGSYLKLFVGGKIALLRQFFGPVMVFSVVGCLGLLTAAIRLWNRPQDGHSDPRLLRVMIAWLVPFAVFLAVFDPASTFHKLFIWPPVVALLCMLGRRHAKGITALAAALACWNFGAFIWPHAHASADPVLAFAQDMGRNLPRNAVIYYSAFSPDDWYLRYFGPQLRWKPLPQLNFQGGNPACLETTALEERPEVWASVRQRWSLITPQHNIRVACIEDGSSKR